MTTGKQRGSTGASHAAFFPINTQTSYCVVFTSLSIAKAIWTQVSPPISGDLENVEISTNNTIAKKQSWYKPNFIKPQKVIAPIRTIDFRVLLEGSSMSRNDVLSEDIVAVSIAVETPSSRTLAKFREFPRKRITFNKIILTTVCGQANVGLTIQRALADRRTFIPVLRHSYN